MKYVGTIVLLLVIPTLAPAQVFSPVVDAVGDAQDPFGAGPPLLDIDVIDVRYDAVNLYYRMTFHTPISPASAMLPDSVGGLLEFDTDQTSETGLPPLQNFFSPPFAMLGTGWDYYVDLFSELFHPGLVEVFDSLLVPVGTFPIVYGAKHFEGTIPLASLGGDDGIVDFTTTIGTVPQPTDATDVYGISVLIPEPATLTLLGLGAVALRRRR